MEDLEHDGIAMKLRTKVGFIGDLPDIWAIMYQVRSILKENHQVPLSGDVCVTVFSREMTLEELEASLAAKQADHDEIRAKAKS